MKITTIAYSASIGVILGAILFGFSKPKDAIATSSQPPTQRTGAPGESNCASCHTGSLLKNGSLSISPGISQYVAGHTYPITVTIDDPGQVRWGFEMTALKDSDNSQAGSFGSSSQLIGIQSAGGRTYAGHDNNGAAVPLDPTDGTYWGTMNGPVSWVVNWTAPSVGSGDVTFYAAGVAANGNGVQDALDFAYTSSAQVTEQAPSPVSNTTWGKIKQQYR